MRTDSHSDTASRVTSVQAQIILGFGLVVVLVLAVALVSYLNLRQLQQEAESALNTDGRIRELGLQIQSDYLLARQHEAGFLTSWRDAGIDAAIAQEAAQNAVHLADAREHLQELETLIQNDGGAMVRPLLENTAALAPLLDTYETAFLSTVDLVEQRARAEGLEASLKSRLDTLEFEVRGLESAALYQAVLQLRANERSYFGTTEQQYADGVKILAGSFVQLVQTADPAQLTAGGRQRDPAALLAEINAYAGEFQQLVTLEESIKTNTILFQDVTADINAIVQDVEVVGEANLAAARQRLESIGRRSLRLLIVSSLLAASLGAAAAVTLGRRIIGPLRRLSAAAAEIGQGRWAQQVTVTEGRELVILARAFNEMSSQLQALFANMEQRVQNRTRALQTTAEVSRTLSSILERRQLLLEVVNQIQAAFDYYHVHIYLLDDMGQDLLMAGGTGEAGQIMLSSGHKIPHGKGLVGQAATSKQAVLVPDVTQAPGWLPNPLLPETKSELAVPILLEQNVLGVIDVQSDQVGGLSEEDMNLLQSIAGQVAVALRNARLYADMRRQATQEAVINQIGQRMRLATDIDSVLQIAAQELGQALSVRRTRVQLEPAQDAAHGRFQGQT